MPTDSVAVSPELQFARDNLDNLRNLSEVEPTYESPVADGEQLPADNTPWLSQEVAPAVLVESGTDTDKIIGDTAQVLDFVHRVSLELGTLRLNTIYPPHSGSGNVVPPRKTAAAHVYVQGELKRAA